MADAPLTNNRLASLLDPLTWLLLRLRGALDEGPPKRPPRWVRIAAARELGPDAPGYTLAREGVRGWIALVSAAHELAMDLIELLDPITAGRVDLERTLRQLRDSLADPTLDLVIADLGEIRLSVTALRDALDLLIPVVDLTPDGDDARALGAQIYALLAIRPTDRPSLLLPGALPPAVDLNGTGRLRLLQWAFDLPWPVRGLGPYEAPETRTVDVRRLGSRWLVAGKNQDQAPMGRAIWVDGAIGSWSVPVYELYFNLAEPDAALRTADLAAIHDLLEALGYFAGPVRPDLRVQWHEALGDALACFQAIHGLPRTRALDRATLNQLLHLDTGGMTTRRARPLDPELWARIPSPPPLPPEEVVVEVRREVAIEVWDEPTMDFDKSGTFWLQNPDANSPEVEGKVPIQDMGSAPPGPSNAGRRPPTWYRIGAIPQNGRANFPPSVRRGWIQHAGEIGPHGDGPVHAGFVALENPTPLAGGLNAGETQGECSTPNGPYFFYARHQAPGTVMRSVPSPSPVWEPRVLEEGTVVGIYQWIDLAALGEIAARGTRYTIQAKATLHVEVPKSGAVPNGRVVIALIDRTAWTTHGYASALDHTSCRAVSDSAWFPDDDPERVTAWRQSLSSGNSSARNLWLERTTGPITWVVDGPAPILYVGLQGRSPGGENIGACFDGLTASWTREDLPDAEMGP